MLTPNRLQGSTPIIKSTNPRQNKGRSGSPGIVPGIVGQDQSYFAVANEQFVSIPTRSPIRSWSPILKSRTMTSQNTRLSTPNGSTPKNKSPNSRQRKGRPYRTRRILGEQGSDFFDVSKKLEGGMAFSTAPRFQWQSTYSSEGKEAHQRHVESFSNRDYAANKVGVDYSWVS